MKWEWIVVEMKILLRLRENFCVDFMIGDMKESENKIKYSTVSQKWCLRCIELIVRRQFIARCRFVSAIDFIYRYTFAFDRRIV